MEILSYQFLKKKNYVMYITLLVLLEIFAIISLNIISRLVDDPLTNFTFRFSIYVLGSIILIFIVILLYRLLMNESLIICNTSQIIRLKNRFNSKDINYQSLNTIIVEKVGKISKAGTIIYELFLDAENLTSITRNNYLEIYTLAKTIHYHTKIPLDLKIEQYTKSQYETVKVIEFQTIETSANRETSALEIEGYKFFFDENESNNQIEYNEIIINEKSIRTHEDYILSFNNNTKLIEVIIFKMQEKYYIHFIFDNFKQFTTQVKHLDGSLSNIRKIF